MINARENNFRPPHRPGEMPPSYVPVRVCIEDIPGFTNDTDLRKIVLDGNNKVADFVNDRLKNGFHVGLTHGVGSQAIAYLCKQKESVFLGEKGVVFEAIKPPKNRKRGK